MMEQGHAAPVLVGGAAVEFYTAGALATGDFDVVTAWQDEFETTLRHLGFTKPEGLGHTALGWVHPELRLGFEVVSSTLLDGMADRDRVAIFDLGDDGSIALLSVEDMIADRMGQYASGSAPEMLQQARALLSLYGDVDWAYLDGRVRYETGNEHGAAAIKPGRSNPAR